MNSGITVIVTTYNNNNCIQKCLLSVINQTQPPKSIIVIDDCSEDIITLKEIIYSLNNTSNIKIELLINEKNSGPGFSRNKAWGLVNTDLVAFLDADDIYYKNKLELQLSILKKYPEAYVIGGQKSRHNTEMNKEINNFKVKKLNFYKMLFINEVATSSVLLKTNIAHKFNTTYYCEDYFLWMTLLKKKLIIIIINTDICSQLNKNENNLSSHHFKMQYEMQKVFFNFYSKNIFLNIIIVTSQLFSVIKTIARYSKIDLKK
jgi:glycosyltransferase involved in cell wall biosynthesis